MISKVSGVSLFAIASMAAAQPLAAQDDAGLAARFGALPAVQGIALSPEGKQVLIVSPAKAGGEIAAVVEVGGEKITPVLANSEANMALEGCRFVIESHLVCRISRIAGANTMTEALNRLVAVGADGTGLRLLTARATTSALYQTNFGGDIVDYAADGQPGSILMTRWFTPESQTGIASHRAEGLGVERVNVITGERKLVEPARLIATGYYGDGQGHVRMMELQAFNSGGYRENEIKYKIRATPEGNWTDFSVIELNDGMSYGFQPDSYDAASNTIYGFASHNNFSALYRKDLAGGEPELVLAKDGAEVDDLIHIGSSQRIIGASFVTDRRQAEYFDPAYKALAGALSKALGGKNITFSDATRDEGKLVVFADSDTDPGTFYLFDKATKQLGVISPMRPELADVELAPMKSVTFPGPDGTPVPGYLTLPLGSEGKPVPAIVMPHGGPSSRDEWGFDWLVQFYAARGYAVLQPNYRGSAGLGNQWYEKNGFQSWQSAIGDINAAGKWLVSSGITTSDKLAIVGWSYGGYAALQSAVVDPDLFKAIVAIAPVTDLERLKLESADKGNHRLIESMVGTGPHIEAGSPARHAGRIKAPVLLVHGDADMNVAVGESRLMNEQLKSAGKDVTYIEFPGLMHQLADPAARTRLLRESDAMLRRALHL